MPQCTEDCGSARHNRFRSLQAGNHAKLRVQSMLGDKDFSARLRRIATSAVCSKPCREYVQSSTAENRATATARYDMQLRESRVL